jgi:hypothetical protein|tara:strand:- start:196 stop:783 length:588 start_codon:yes stop_codon:yes gene_type:complete
MDYIYIIFDTLIFDILFVKGTIGSVLWDVSYIFYWCSITILFSSLIVIISGYLSELIFSYPLFDKILIPIGNFLIQKIKIVKKIHYWMKNNGIENNRIFGYSHLIVSIVGTFVISLAFAVPYLWFWISSSNMLGSVIPSTGREPVTFFQSYHFTTYILMLCWLVVFIYRNIKFFVLQISHVLKLKKRKCHEKNEE